MNVYQTDIDGVYVGDTVADQDPLDSNNWLIPAGCVKTAPPTITDSQLAKWNGTEWVVKNIPVAEPDQEPEPLSLAETVRAKRNQLLVASDNMALADRITDEWRLYRQLLRNVPAQAGFPDNITWPTEPS